MISGNKIFSFFFSALILILLIWYFRFSLKEISWYQFVHNLHGNFASIISFTGVIVTLLLGLISDRRNQSNIKIEQQKKRPLLQIEIIHNQDLLQINMKNIGEGPLIIAKFKLIDLSNYFEYNGFLNCLYDNTINRHTERGLSLFMLNHISGNLKDTILIAGKEINLLLMDRIKIQSNYVESFESELKAINDSESSSINEYVKILDVLKYFKIVVFYKDIYGKSMPPYQRNLTELGRQDPNFYGKFTRPNKLNRVKHYVKGLLGN